MADFEEKLDRFTDQGVEVIAASSETLDEAKETVEKAGLRYPVGYELSPESFAQETGAYWSDDGTYLHATGFLINPKGVVDIAVFSSGAIGRLTADDTLQILDYRLK